MASIKKLIQDIEAAPGGPQVGAIFDFDGTVIAGYSVSAFLREQLKRGDIEIGDLAELIGTTAKFGLGNIGFSGLMAVTAKALRGIDEAEYIAMSENLYIKQIARLIYPESRALIEAHRAKGHTLAIISSATPYQVKPAAADLGIDNVLCTLLEVEDGVLTGGVVRPTCFGVGKVTAAESLGVNLDQSFFYSDSHDDIQLLERVGFPRVLNPGNQLARIARSKHWPIATFSSRGRPSIGQVVRNLAGIGTGISAVLAGLPMWALTGSKRDSLNFSTGLFADISSAMLGIDFEIEGEEHLWSHRPAVFVFNHQSNADVIIIAKLLRKDITGVGKHEIKKAVPLVGALMEFGGSVLIDRSDAKSAIKAMSALRDIMMRDKLSVVVAPEGTRTVSPTLAPFKKGAFHIAMQAGVPMVPVVIRNAGDVMPKGGIVLRPATIEVKVLPPVDTSNWKPATINEHVREVRNMFARTLGQPEQPPPLKTPGKTSDVARTRAAAKKARTTAKRKAAPKKKTTSRS